MQDSEKKESEIFEMLSMPFRFFAETVRIAFPIECGHNLLIKKFHSQKSQTSLLTALKKEVQF
jgi:hypothetical protein